MRREFNVRERTFENASDCGLSVEFNSCISQSEHAVGSTNQIAQLARESFLKDQSRLLFSSRVTCSRNHSTHKSSRPPSTCSQIALVRETWDDLLGTQFESVRQISHHLTQYLTSLLAQSRCGVFIIAGEYPPVCYSSYLVLKLPLRLRLPSDCESSPLSALPS